MVPYQDSLCASSAGASLGADPFKPALYLIPRVLEGTDARIVHTLHDEIVIEAGDAIEDRV